MQNRYAQFKRKNKIDEPGSSFSGWLKERVTRDIQVTMDKIRDKNTSIRKEVKTLLVEKFAEIMKLSKSPDTYTCATSIGIYYVNTIKILNDFHEVVQEIENEYQELYERLESEHMEAINQVHEKLSLRGKLPKTSFVNENGIIKIAIEWAPWKWFRTDTDPKISGYEKMFPKRVKEFKKELEKTLDALRTLHTSAAQCFEKMNESIKERNVGEWIENIAEYKKAFEKFENVYIAFYMKNLKPIKDWKDRQRTENEKKNQIPEEDKTQVFNRNEVKQKLNEDKYEQVRDSDIVSVQDNQPATPSIKDISDLEKYPILKNQYNKMFSNYKFSDKDKEIILKGSENDRKAIYEKAGKEILDFINNQIALKMSRKANKLSALIKYAQSDNTPGMISEILKLSEKYESIDKTKSSKLLRIAEGLIYGR